MNTTTKTRVTYDVVSSPIGSLLLTGDDDALSGLYMMHDARFVPDISPDWRKAPGAFARTAQELDAYFSGDLYEFSASTAPVGTPFQLSVWRALTEIPYGTTTTYGAIANAVGRPQGARAVGGAIGRNPICVIVACHRVIGSNGTLTGFGGGLQRKQWLLNLESNATNRVF